MIPPDVVLSFSYIGGLLSIVRFYWFGSLGGRAFWHAIRDSAAVFPRGEMREDGCGIAQFLNWAIKAPQGPSIMIRIPIAMCQKGHPIRDGPFGTR